MDGYNIKRRTLEKFFKMSNGQYLKIIFSYSRRFNIWNMDVIVASNKRQCNDCVRKSFKSPKKIYGQITGKGIGIEPFIIAKNELLKLETNLHTGSRINICGANDRLRYVYTYLKRYGYKQYTDGYGNSVMYKNIV